SLGAPPGADVGEYPIGVADALMYIRADRAAVAIQPLAAARPQAILEIERPARLDKPFESIYDAWSVTGMNELQPLLRAHAAAFLGGQTQNGKDVRSEPGRPSQTVDGPRHVGQVGDQPAV